MCKFCSTLICQNCIDKITELPIHIQESQIKCHECKNILNLTESHKITKKGMDMIHLRCPSDNVNCFEEYKLKDLYKHLEVCKYWEGKSKCNSCGYVDTTANIKKHIEVCADFLMPCKFCEDFIKRKDIPKHEDNCFKKPINCKVCHIKFSKENVQIKDHPSQDLCMINLVKEVAEKLESKILIK